MNIVYLILVHKNPEQLLRLINSLECDNASFVIHLDKRISIKQFKYQVNFDLKKSVFFLNQRCVTKWGGFELVQATLNGFEYIQKNMPLAERVIILSGDDYPIKCKSYITSFLRANKDVIYTQYFKIPYSKWYEGGRTRFPDFGNFDKKFSVYGGSQWMSIPRYVINVIFDFITLNPTFVSYYKSVIIPDESFFQTLLLNCNVEKVRINLKVKNLHLIKWDKPYLHPRALNINDINLIKKSKSLYARKFDNNLCSEILDMIDDQILYDY